MKQITLLSIVLAALLFSGCGEETKKQAAEATAITEEAVQNDTDDVKEVAKNLTEATKVKAVELAKAAKEEADRMAEQAAQAAKELKQKAVETSHKAQEMADAVLSNKEKGKVLYAKCAGCHGQDGKTQALGKSEEIAGQSVLELKTKIKAYKKGDRNVAGMGTLMKGQVLSMTDEEIKDISAYISTL